MVKADPKHDYYADLELPPTADTETIKKQFRILAKQYHPDRNPGREIEVVEKFQAIQAAHEILCDPAQKKSYDRDRAKPNHSHENTETYTFKKPPKPPPGASQFPPPPKRDPGLNRPFNPRPSRPSPSTSAEKFASFTRPTSQSWDRPPKFEDSAKAEALRNLNNMRNHSQGPPPRVPPRAAPTAPRPPSTGASTESLHGGGPSPGFPGLSRTNSRRGFAPGTPGTDEPPAPSSAYAHVHRSERPPPQASGFSYPQGVPKAGTAASPPSQRNRPSESPLRQTKSSGFEDVQRPGLQRTSSRYAAHSGERTDIHTAGLSRSTSVRNSPTGHHFDESGPFGSRHQSQQHQSGFKAPPPRHHSSSPRGRSRRNDNQYSASESTSSEDEPIQTNSRPRMTPQKPQPYQGHRTFSDDDPALTGQFRSNNYNTKVHADKYYNYPPPPETNGASFWKGRDESSNPVDEITQDLNNAGIRHVHRDDVPLKKTGVNRSNDANDEPSRSTRNTESTFSAAEWDGKFTSDANVFRPSESTTSRSRSPTKQSKPKLPNRNRTAAQSQDGRTGEADVANDASVPSKMPGVRHVSGVADGLSTAAAFQAKKFSVEDWAEKLRGQNGGIPDGSSQKRPSAPTAPPRDTGATPKVATQQPHVQDEAEAEDNSPLSPKSQPRPNVQHHDSATVADAMDIDEVAPHTVTATQSANAGLQTTSPHSRRPSTGGVNLHPLAETAPFKPSATGLDDLTQMHSDLPFKSRAAEELNLHQAPSSGQAARHLKLPPPPKPVMSPDENHLTQESWAKYSEKMSTYIDEWNIFNCKMIDHFRTRQQQISLAMYHNWVTAVGDGASADDFDGVDFVGGSDVGSKNDPGDGENAAHTKPKKAGYSTYMQWLEQDRVCRTWWEVAFDEHTKCMEDLGRVRKLVKTIRARESGKTV